MRDMKSQRSQPNVGAGFSRALFSTTGTQLTSYDFGLIFNFLTISIVDMQDRVTCFSSDKIELQRIVAEYLLFT